MRQFARSALAVLRLRLGQTFSSWKNISILALTGIYLWSCVEPVGTFADMAGIKVRPWLFPHLINDYIIQMMLAAGCVALFSDAPWRDDLREYVAVRTGRRAESAGHVLYIIVLSGLYTLFILLMSVLPILTKTEFSAGWGKVLGTLARSGRGQEVGLTFAVYDILIGAYEPGWATGVSFLLEWGCFAFLGLTVYLFNRHVGRTSGILAGGFFVFLDLTAYNNLGARFYRISPLTLAQLSQFRGANELLFQIDFPYAARFFALSLAGLTALIILLSRRHEK